MPERHSPRLVALLCGLLAALTAAVYCPLVTFDFSDFDDQVYVTENWYVLQGLSGAGLKWAFMNLSAGFWHPLTWLSLMLDSQLFGTHAGGYHLTNLLLHAASTALLFLVLRQATGALWRSAVVAALFAVHPLHVEPVAWIASRKDVLSTFFGFLSLMFYVRYAQAQPSAATHPSLDPPPASFRLRSSALSYLLALVFFCFGLMSKTMLVTLPVVMLLLDYWPLRRNVAGRRQNEELRGQKSDARSQKPEVGVHPSYFIIEKVPFFAAALLAGLLTVHAEKGVGAVSPLAQVPLAIRVSNALLSYGRYLLQMFWPHDLVVFYPFPAFFPPSAVAAAAVFLVVASLVVLRFAKRHPYGLTGWLWYVITLLPVSGLIQVGSHSHADRYTYVPLIGVFILVVWGAADVLAHWGISKSRMGVAAGLILVPCVVQTSIQLRYWKDCETLFRRAVAVTIDNSMAYNNLGAHYSRQHNLDEAERCYRIALATSPRLALAWHGLAGVLVAEGRDDEAMADCETALRLDPHQASALVTRGLLLMKQGRAEAAIADYSEAVRIKPHFASAHYNLANALLQQGQVGAAKEHYEESLRLEPGAADAHNNLAYLLAGQGKWDEAVAQFRATLALQADFWQARYGLADALARQRRNDEAVQEFTRLLDVPAAAASARRQLDLLQAGATPPAQQPPKPREMTNE